MSIFFECQRGRGDGTHHLNLLVNFHLFGTLNTDRQEYTARTALKEHSVTCSKYTVGLKEHGQEYAARTTLKEHRCRRVYFSNLAE
jgi:hypothetical protein